MTNWKWHFLMSPPAVLGHLLNCFLCFGYFTGRWHENLQKQFPGISSGVATLAFIGAGIVVFFMMGFTDATMNPLTENTPQEAIDKSEAAPARPEPPSVHPLDKLSVLETLCARSAETDPFSMFQGFQLCRRPRAVVLSILDVIEWDLREHIENKRELEPMYENLHVNPNHCLAAVAFVRRNASRLP